MKTEHPIKFKELSKTRKNITEGNKFKLLH